MDWLLLITMCQVLFFCILKIIIIIIINNKYAVYHAYCAVNLHLTVPVNLRNVESCVADSFPGLIGA